MAVTDRDDTRDAPGAPGETVSGAGLAAGGPREKAMTIGAVVKALIQEFPDISISKIRYLEDQKLLTPRRTPGGYRLYSASDVQRLRTILRLQRDEFLPLRVIRQELAGGRSADEPPAGEAATAFSSRFSSACASGSRAPGAVSPRASSHRRTPAFSARPPTSSPRSSNSGASGVLSPASLTRGARLAMPSRLATSRSTRPTSSSITDA